MKEKSFFFLVVQGFTPLSGPTTKKTLSYILYIANKTHDDNNKRYNSVINKFKTIDNKNHKDKCYESGLVILEVTNGRWT